MLIDESRRKGLRDFIREIEVRRSREKMEKYERDGESDDGVCELDK